MFGAIQDGQMCCCFYSEREALSTAELAPQKVRRRCARVVQEQHHFAGSSPDAAGTSARYFFGISLSDNTTSLSFQIFFLLAFIMRFRLEPEHGTVNSWCCMKSNLRERATLSVPRFALFLVQKKRRERPCAEFLAKSPPAANPAKRRRKLSFTHPHI